MTKNEAAEALAELMNAYKENRVKWIAHFGSAEGFDDWFTTQVKKR